MKKLPSDLTEDQRQNIWGLLVKYETIMSTGDHDIGQSDLIEHHIDTGNSRPIAQEDRYKSAFVTRSGCYRFTVMPFGLTCAPSEFQPLMDCVLCGLSYITCLVYLDDVIVFGSTFEEELARLDEVFSQLQAAKLKLKPSKCSLFQHNVEFLGHAVSKEGIAMQDEKISAICD